MSCLCSLCSSASVTVKWTVMVHGVQAIEPVQIRNANGVVVVYAADQLNNFSKVCAFSHCLLFECAIIYVCFVSFKCKELCATLPQIVPTDTPILGIGVTRNTVWSAS